MDANITDIIKDIKGKTGIDITVFDMLGNIVSSTKENPHNYTAVSTDRFANNVYSDTKNNISCFLFNSPYNMFMGVIDNAGTTARNYAFMISAMMESALMQTEENYDKEKFLKQIISGEASNSKIRRLAKKFSLFDLPCFVLAVSCERDKVEEVLNYLTQLAGDSKDIALLVEENIIAYIRNIEVENDYQSAVDFAEMLYDNIEHELSIKVKVGVGSYAKNAFDFANAYSQASNAIKMGVITNSKNNIFSYKEFVMMRMIEEIPEAILKKYLDILLDSGAKDILNDSEMLNTAEEFLANSLNISETSRKLYMHRNTLMYRLDKIEKITGLNIRRFSDAVTFHIIVILYKHLKY